jgi:hypothetical protein
MKKAPTPTRHPTAPANTLARVGICVLQFSENKMTMGRNGSETVVGNSSSLGAAPWNGSYRQTSVDNADAILQDHQSR